TTHPQRSTIFTYTTLFRSLEHATIVLLSKKFPEVRFSGISFAAGFFVFGDIPTEAILPTAEEALNLLRTTQPELAVHERCGTNRSEEHTSELQSLRHLVCR